MDKVEIEKGNFAITLFMGYEYPDMNNKIWELQKDDLHNYHEDWRLLMPVVEKIINIKHGITFQTSFSTSLSIVSVYDYDNEYQICQERFSTSINSQIETMFIAVISFIHWYHTQPKIKSTNN